jgi:DNA-binding MarR family transcriptional regulator
MTKQGVASSPPGPDAAEATWARLWSACLVLRRGLGRDLSKADVGMSLPEFMALRHVELAEAGMSLTELGRRAGLSAAGTTRIVGHLVDAGYVELSRPTPDRRVQHVRMLPAAQQPLAAAHVAVRDRLADMPDVLSAGSTRHCGSG